MKLKITYSSGIKPEVVGIGEVVPSEYIIRRFGSAFELTKLGGSYALIEEAPLQTMAEVETAPATAPFTAATAVEEVVAPKKTRK
jgi:hypothetical protein